MKISILASGNGEKGLYLHEFFKEGNRITVDSIITDNPEAPVLAPMKEEGIEIFYLLPDGATTPQIASLLQERGVELLVVDDFEGEVPAPLLEAFGKAVVKPSGVASAPLEVIEAGKRSEPSDTPAACNAVELEKEWADVLKDDQPAEDNPAPEETPETPAENSDNAEAPETIETIETIETVDNGAPQQPQYQGQPPYGYQQPQQPWGPQQPPTQPWGHQQAPQRPSEPMPDTYLVWSVIITILCCLIPGVVAIIYSASVSSKYYAGDLEGAKRASRNAQVWCIVSIVVGILWATFYLPLAFLL